ncbi:STAS domain-containing protein [Lentzea albida]|uniref:Anti-anti-sigma factor n=1 Tax=Lentzea albida TaxID=65499 RepID=A0A1H9XF06_9PSEU|nr:STAS domain-containing protein [Lentzea albida]SES44629.1 anti-anti-sigma factor [Lentzea albida]
MGQQSDGAVSALTAHTVDRDGIAVVVVAGEIDMVTEDSPLDQALDAVRRRPAGLVIDLGAVSFFGSSGINMVLNVWRHAVSESVPLAVVAGRTVSRPLDMSGAAAVLSLHPNLAEALAAVRTVPPQRRR